MDSVPITVCAACGMQLPLRMPRPGETAHEWECRNCGRRTTGVFDENARATIRMNVIEIRRGD